MSFLGEFQKGKHAFFRSAGSLRTCRRGQRWIAGILMMMLFGSIVTVPVLAYGENSNKQEVVYINLNGDGSVDGIYVVNQFELNDTGRIIDYGDYTALRNLTTDDQIRFDNQTVKIDTTARKLYYQGTLNSNVIPWNFEIHYYINEMEYPADQMAGKSGKLKITMHIGQNPDCNSHFFDHYALQASFALDTDKCSRIIAADATQANVGRDRQITYTILPGKGKEIKITADVRNFEMDGISINGIPLSLTVDVDVENNADIEELQDGVSDLDNGANDLNDGAQKLNDGAGDLVDGLKDLRDGTDELSDGANELKDGADTLHDGVQALDNGADDLVDGADDLADGSRTLSDGASDVNDGMQALYDGAKELDDGLGTLKDGAKDLKAGAKSVAAGAAQLYSGLNVLKAENSDIQTLSTALYTAALAQYGPILSGYSVCAGSTTGELQAMMEQRQAELTDDSAKASATQEAVTSRVNTLRSIVSGPDASYAAEEIAAAQYGLDYWNMTQAIQGEEAYRKIQESSGQDAADVSAYKSAHEAYDSYASGYGDETVFLTAYQALADTVGETEQAAVTGLVSAALAQSVSDDPIYQVLAVLSYYQGIINYTEGVASAASGASTISWGSESLYDGASQLYDGVKALQGGSSDMLNVISSLMDGTAELREGTLELHDGVLTLRDGVVALKDGTQDLLDGITTLQDGTLTLCDGTITLRDGTVTLLDGAIELHDCSVKLHNGTMDLVNGTLELRDKTTDASLKEKLQKAIDDELGSNDFTPISFVSDRNTEVDFVQFVVKTPEISLPDGDYVEQVPKKLTVWQKFLSLFGFYQA